MVFQMAIQLSLPSRLDSVSVAHAINVTIAYHLLHDVSGSPLSAYVC